MMNMIARTHLTNTHTVILLLIAIYLRGEATRLASRAGPLYVYC